MALFFVPRNGYTCIFIVFTYQILFIYYQVPPGPGSEISFVPPAEDDAVITLSSDLRIQFSRS